MNEVDATIKCLDHLCESRRDNTAGGWERHRWIIGALTHVIMDVSVFTGQPIIFELITMDHDYCRTYGSGFKLLEALAEHWPHLAEKLAEPMDA
jgi:hypothetical protein